MRRCGASLRAEPWLRVIAGRSAGGGSPMRRRDWLRCCPNGDKRGKSCGGAARRSVNRSCMSESDNPPVSDGFTTAGPDVIAPGEGELIVNLEGFEGPLD